MSEVVKKQIGSIEIRPMTFTDLEEVVEAEKEFWGFVDEDFCNCTEHPRSCSDNILYPPWTMNKEDIQKMVRQRTKEKSGVYETFAYVADTLISIKKGESADWVCAWFSYEQTPVSFEINHLVVHPHCQQDIVLDNILAKMKRKANDSPKRRKVVAYILDIDSAIRVLLPAFKRNGFSIQLVPDYFKSAEGWKHPIGDTDDMCSHIDAWKCQYDAPELNLDGSIQDEGPSLVKA